MASDVMTVRLHLPQIRVLEVVEDTPGALVVSVESTFRRLRCPQCGFRCHRVHDRRDKKVRDLEVSGRRTVLVWSRRRMVCDNCDSRFLEDHPAFEGALTGRLARRLVADAKVMTFSAAARRHGVHWHVWVPIIRSWALTRGFALHPGTRNRYEIRYTRTQHRPPSRQVNDHDRVSGIHVCPEGK